MLFNSIGFLVFLLFVFFVYWFVLSRKLWWQNLFIVVASYFFYGWWDWRFLSLIFFSTIVDYTVAILLGQTVRVSRRRSLLLLSMVVNLGMLGYFKYYGFFIGNLTVALSSIGISLDLWTLNVVLPVGISFYTFQTLSYTIDVYRKQLSPTKDFVAFAAFVSFFPQLVAGPIERATHLLPQFHEKRRFDYDLAVDGLRQILWGFLKKMVIADTCATYVNMIFSNSAELSGSTLAFGMLCFSFQIYGDFSGYSDIAIGTARLFGFDLMQNFAFPYFSRDIAEFWRRWHISLSTWFRDYLYIPLGGSRGAMVMKIRNIFIIFLVSGFWHGANWTFVAWGFLNAVYFLPLFLNRKNRVNVRTVAAGRFFPSPWEIVQVAFTFMLTLVAWTFFRADSVGHAVRYLSGVCSLSLFSLPEISKGEFLQVMLILSVFVFIEWVGRERKYAIENLGGRCPRGVRWGFYATLIFLIGMYMETGKSAFIYFQF